MSVIENVISKIYAVIEPVNGVNWVAGLFNADRQTPVDGDVFIKDAIGDEALAPMSVYEESFIDGLGRYNYKLDGKNIVLVDESEKPQPTPIEQAVSDSEKIDFLVEKVAELTAKVEGEEKLAGFVEDGLLTQKQVATIEKTIRK